jgi:hypothetical protein
MTTTRGEHGSDQGGFPSFSYPTSTLAGLQKSTRHLSKTSNTRAGYGIAGRVGFNKNQNEDEEVKERKMSVC